jgi:hypothetical protein
MPGSARAGYFHAMRILRMLPMGAAFALAVLCVLPLGARAQTGEALTPADTEAQQMGLQMAIACNPRRQGELQGSESTVRRASDALPGTAVFSRTAEGTFLSLEQYDEAFEGHCLVFGWFGGAYALGRHPISRLSMRAMEEEQASGVRSFYTWGAVRSTAENVMLMVDSGSVEILTIEQGRIIGTFELTGALVDGNTRAGEVTWSGSFSAVEGE